MRNTASTRSDFIDSLSLPSTRKSALALRSVSAARARIPPPSVAEESPVIRGCVPFSPPDSAPCSAPAVISLPIIFIGRFPTSASSIIATGEALSPMVGVDLRLDEQLQRLESFVDRYRDEMHFPNPHPTIPRSFISTMDYFETVDAEIAYSMVRHYKPRRMIEIGGGNSTRLSAAAMLRNAQEGFPGKLFTVEPSPIAVLRAGFPGLTRLIQRPVQQIPLEFFDRLEDGDILFLDSSHVVSVGSDVLYEYLEILPRLHPGRHCACARRLPACRLSAAIRHAQSLFLGGAISPAGFPCIQPLLRGALVQQRRAHCSSERVCSGYSLLARQLLAHAEQFADFHSNLRRI